MEDGPAADELFVVEATRVCLDDRDGELAVLLRCGETLRGQLLRDVHPVSGHVLMTTARPSGGELLVATAAIVCLSGGRRRLRDEDSTPTPRSLAMRLREQWAGGQPLRALLCDGRWFHEPVTLVGGDHVEFGGRRVVPFTAVEAWRLG